MREVNDNAVLAHFESACPSCGYNLRGLITTRGAVCPECGVAATLAEIFVQELAAADRFRWRNLLWMLTPGLVIVLMLLLARISPGDEMPLITGLLNGIGIFVFCAMIVIGPIAIVAWSWDALGNLDGASRVMAAIALTIVMLAVNIAMIAFAVTHAL